MSSDTTPGLDAEIRSLEQEAEANPDDLSLKERVLNAQYRAGLVTPWHYETRKTELARAKVMLGLANDLPPLLPDWRAAFKRNDMGYSWLDLHHDETGGVVSARFEADGKVLSFSCRWPSSSGEVREFRPKDAVTSIKLSASKTPQQIAREVERRLLAGFLPSLKTALEEKRAYERGQDAAHDLAAEYARILDENYDRKAAERSSRKFEVRSYKGSGLPVAHVKIHPDSDDRPEVSIELKCLPAPLATKLLTLFRRERKRLEAEAEPRGG